MARIASGWDVDPSLFTGLVEEDLAQLRTTIVLDAHKSIVLRTPVKSGRARGSWAISYNSPVPQDMIASSANEAITRGFQQLLPGSQEPFAKVVISSSLPYIEKLERGEIGKGGSKQAPQGMVAITMAGLNAKYR